MSHELWLDSGWGYGLWLMVLVAKAWDYMLPRERERLGLDCRYPLCERVIGRTEPMTRVAKPKSWSVKIRVSQRLVMAATMWLRLYTALIGSVRVAGGFDILTYD